MAVEQVNVLNAIQCTSSNGYMVGVMLYIFYHNVYLVSIMLYIFYHNVEIIYY